jgi:hypothetical protein
MNKQLFPVFFLVALLGASLTGCAVGNRHAFHDIRLSIAAQGTQKLAVATLDQRPYILNSDKNPSFVGLQRGGFGNPFDINTASGNPLAQDINQTVADALKKRGYSVIEVPVSHSDNLAAVKMRLKGEDAYRILFFTLNEWKSDTYQNTALAYDIQLLVMDDQGRFLAEKRISGKDNLGGSFINPPAHAKAVVPRAFKERIEMLLNDHKIEEALK